MRVVVLGGGLISAELVGELTAFADDLLRFNPRIRRDELCFGCRGGPARPARGRLEAGTPGVEQFSGTTARPLTDFARGACE